MLIFVGAILLISIMNLLLTSGIAMWSFVGPVLVPMLMRLNIYPGTSRHSSASPTHRPTH